MATYNLDPARVEAAITQLTEAILPVHLYGQTADMDRIRRSRTPAFGSSRTLRRAHGAPIQVGDRVGRSVIRPEWSFYPGKNLGALGDAGAVTSDDDASRIVCGVFATTGRA